MGDNLRRDKRGISLEGLGRQLYGLVTPIFKRQTETENRKPMTGEERVLERLGASDPRNDLLEICELDSPSLLGHCVQLEGRQPRRAGPAALRPGTPQTPDPKA